MSLRGSPAMAFALPPRKGPMLRHLRPLNWEASMNDAGASVLVFDFWAIPENAISRRQARVMVRMAILVRTGNIRKTRERNAGSYGSGLRSDEKLYRLAE